MKAVILAAGMGSRLTTHSDHTPKCLLEVGGKALLDHQLDALYSNNIKDINIVTGHLADKIKAKASNRAKCVFNPLYNKAGILYSLQAVKEYLYDHEFICMAGDIIFNPEILRLILDAKGDIVLGVERKKCDDEDSKVLISNNEVIKMGKKLNKINNGELITEYVHIAKFSEKASKVFFDNVEKLIKAGDKNAYMMCALNDTLKNGIKAIPVYSNGFPRTEIDFIEDLEKARRMKW